MILISNKSIISIITNIYPAHKLNVSNIYPVHKLFSSAKRLVSCFGSIIYTHSFHESNHMTDHLAKQEVHRLSDFVAWL
jgi:hypothetical protein